MTKTSYQSQFTGAPSKFGSAAHDANGVALQTATQFATQDAAGTPTMSPFTYSGATIYALTVPDSAVQLVISATTDIRVSEDPGVTRYDFVAGGSKEAFAVALMQSVYIQRDTADGTAYFRFATV